MRRRAAALFGLLIIALAVIQARFHDAPALRAVESTAFDWRLWLRPGLPAGDDVVIVVIDDATLRRLGHWPLPRDALAEAFVALADAGASVVALDLLLLEREVGNQLENGAHNLVTAIKRTPTAVLAMAFGFGEPVPVDLADRLALARDAIPIAHSTPGAVDVIGEPSGVHLPFRPLADHARLGHVNVFVEPAGELRHLQPAIRFDGAWYPALPVQAAALHRRVPAERLILTTGRSLQLGDVTAPLDAASRLVINSYGPPGQFPQHALIDLLEGRLDPTLFAGRVVIVGATATGVRDRFGTAFHPQVPGVEIFATVVDNLLTGRFIDRSAWTNDLSLGLIVLVPALGLVLFLPLPGLLLAALATLLLALPFVLAALALILHGLWLDITLATLGVAIVAAVALARRLALLKRQSRQHQALSRKLERYVSPLMRARLSEGEEVDRSQLAAILFADLEGFTQAAERLDPASLQAELQRFYALIERTATAHDGVVAGYAGDGAMLIFGLPEPSPADAARALHCAVAMLDAMPAWRTEATEPGLAGLRLRIGVNYGRVRIGHVGGGEQIQLTATGDVVNVASRLQAATRQADTSILASATAVEAARAQFGDDAVAGFTARPALRLRGRDTAVPVYAWSG